MTSQQIIPESMKTSIIRICSYDDKNLKGTFYNHYYGEEIAFGNLTRLLLLMEDMMNSMNCPQSSVRSRRFGKEAKIPEKNSMVQQQKLDKPVIATFTVRVLFRQEASWQGKLCWLEGKQEKTFRSALELIKLLDSVLPQPEPHNLNLIGEVPKTG